MTCRPCSVPGASVARSRANISITIMRAPQRGHGQPGEGSGIFWNLGTPTRDASTAWQYSTTPQNPARTVL